MKFFAKGRSLNSHNSFAHMLKGLEDDWIDLGENNFTTYTNLSPGEYTLMIKSTNSSNIWNEKPTTLKITILPPWYQTWWAYLIYFSIAVLIIYFSLRNYNRRLKLKLDVDMANFKTKQEHDLTERKISFFTSIAHDLKTTATLISAPVNDLLSSSNLDNDQIKKLNVIKRNAKMLYKLNVELLEFRKITKNKLPLKVNNVDINLIINDVYNYFADECSRKYIEYTLDIQDSIQAEDETYIDDKKIERIMLNLISNAIKHTDKGGKISLTVNKFKEGNDVFIEFKVSDNGNGFDISEAEKIFDRFYQSDSSSSNSGGVGIGLFIVKELTNLHHGKISVESEIGKGSTFTVSIPVSKNKYSNVEISDKEWNYTPNDATKTIVTKPTNNSDTKFSRKYNQQSIMIVEDNDELRAYLTDHFAKDNTVFAAKNGKEALEIVKDKNIDIIISDVDMPEMNGYELCELVKKDFNSSHIPFILLTGNTALDHKLRGMRVGADSYITKPFEISYVDAVVDSLLANRFKLREKFMGIEPISPEEKTSEEDIVFGNKLKEIVLDNISNPDLNIDILSEHFGVSRSQLNRKVKALVGTTPGNYIKTMRLKKAYEMLRDKNSRVSEVAYQTGFSDPNYFTLCFKKEFGKNPSKISE